MSFWQSEFESQFNGARVLVTGATGFLGWRLCEALSQLGSEVTGLSRTASQSSLPSGIAPLSVDLRDSESVSSRLDGTGYDLVFHLAGYVSASQDRALVIPMVEGNLLTTVNLLDTLSSIGCERLVMVGSSEEPEGGSDSSPGSPYAAAKAAATAYALMYHNLYGLPVVVLRLFMTYGPRQSRTKLVPYTMCTLIEGGSPSVSSGERICDFMFVDDAVLGMLKAAVAPAEAVGEIFDLGSGAGISVRELVTRIAKMIDSTGNPNFSGPQDRKAESNRIANLARTTAILGWEPTFSLSHGLGETIEWYRRELVAEAVR